MGILHVISTGTYTYAQSCEQVQYFVHCQGTKASGHFNDNDACGNKQVDNLHARLYTNKQKASHDSRYSVYSNHLPTTYPGSEGTQQDGRELPQQIRYISLLHEFFFHPNPPRQDGASLQQARKKPGKLISADARFFGEQAGVFIYFILRNKGCSALIIMYPNEKMSELGKQ